MWDYEQSLLSATTIQQKGMAQLQLMKRVSSIDLCRL